MKSIEKFAQEVANTIRKEHSNNDEGSFIFGISGKWGEGKTYFLGQLADQLTDFEIIRINPWKFAGDRISFLRDFLRQLKTVKPDIKSKFWSLLGQLLLKRKRSILAKTWTAFIYELHKQRDFLVEDDFYKLESDTSGVKINWAYFVVICSWLLFIVLIYFNLSDLLLITPHSFQEWFSSNKEKIKILTAGLGFIGIAIALVEKVISTKTTTKAASTVDQFDKVLSKIFTKLSKKKLLIMVDDLDRVTPEVARNVLDNLRTFFDKKEISFVVTGDHSVLERYIGIQTLQRGDPGEQLEEGRRFLKKIFNYYWRLPIPIDQEFDSFIDEKFSQNKEQLKLIFTADQLTILKSYLKTYFEKNFRQVTRFLDTILFTFKVISLQLDGANDENKKYFEDLKKHPLLMVRILMIQDLCTPLFEEMLKDPNILFDLEYAAEKADNTKIEGIVSKYNNDLSVSRRIFITRFLFEKPRFYKESRLTVSAIQPFLYLAADAGWGDSRGPSPADFKASMQTNDPDQIKKSLLDSGEPRIKESSQAALELFKEIGDVNQRNNYLKAVLTALISVPKEHISQRIFCEALVNFDFSSSFSVDPPTRMEFINLFWKWLDIFSVKNETAKYKEKFQFTDSGDFNLLDPGNSGKFTTTMTTNWLCVFYGSNKNDALEKMTEVLPKLKLNIDEVREELENIKGVLITDLINDAGTSDAREKMFTIIVDNLKNGALELKAKILSSISQRNESVWQWATSKADPTSKLWTPSDLQQQLLDVLKSTDSPQSFIETVRFCNGKVTTSLKGFWDIIINIKFEYFFSNFEAIADDSSFNPLVPSTSTAIVLFKKVVRSVEDLGDENRKIELIARLGPDRWCWSTYNHLFAKRDLKSLLSHANPNIKEHLENIINRWQENNKTGA